MTMLNHFARIPQPKNLRSVLFGLAFATYSVAAPAQIESAPPAESNDQATDNFLELLSSDTSAPVQPTISDSQPSEPVVGAQTDSMPTDGSGNQAAGNQSDLGDIDQPAQTPAIISVPQPSREKNIKVAAPSGSHAIEEITVTATKREESLRQIPASIDAIAGAKLEESGKQSLNDFLQESPGVTMSQSNSGYSQISIRGISTDTKPIAETPSPVGIFIGDTAFTDPYLASIVPDLSAFDLSGVQILKGPQGTLFGGAALSGAIRYELQSPVLGEWQARSFAQFMMPSSGVGVWTEGAVLNAPVFDTAAIRLAYINRNYPGAYDDIRSNPVQKGIDKGGGDQFRAIAMWQPSDEWKFKLTHLQQTYSSPNISGIADQPNGPRQTSQLVVPSPASNRFSLDSLEANYDFDEMRLVSLTSHTQKKSSTFLDVTSAAVGSPPPQGYPESLAFILASESKTHSMSQEIRLQSTGDDPFVWLVGAYYYDYGYIGSTRLAAVALTELTEPGSFLSNLLNTLNLPINLATTTSFIYGDYNIKSNEYAAFTDLSYQLTDSLKLSAGARFYRTSVGGVVNKDGLLVLAGNDGMPTRVDVARAQNGINPKASLTYAINDDMLLYATVVKGFRFGGINTTPSTAQVKVPTTYKSDTLWNYETGLRTNWLDDSLHADITAFYIKYKDPIIKQQTGSTIYTDNVGGAVSQGLEGKLLWYPPVDGLMLSLSGGLTDAHTTETFTSATGAVVGPGTQMPGAARSQYSASAQYLLPLPLAIVTSSLGYTYVGKGFNEMTHSIPINDYGTLSAGVSLSTLVFNLKPRLSFNVANILNVTTPIAGSTAPALLNPLADGTVYYLNPPRTFVARFSVDF